MQRDQQFTSEAFSQHWKNLRGSESACWYCLSQSYCTDFTNKIINVLSRNKWSMPLPPQTFRFPQANTYIYASSTTDNSIPQNVIRVLEKLIKAIISPVGSGGDVWGVYLWLGGTWTASQTVWPSWDWMTKDAEIILSVWITAELMLLPWVKEKTISGSTKEHVRLCLLWGQFTTILHVYDT